MTVESNTVLAVGDAVYRGRSDAKLSGDVAIFNTRRDQQLYGFDLLLRQLRLGAAIYCRAVDSVHGSGRPAQIFGMVICSIPVDVVNVAHSLTGRWAVCQPTNQSRQLYTSGFTVPVQRNSSVPLRVSASTRKDTPVRCNQLPPSVEAKTALHRVGNSAIHYRLSHTSMVTHWLPDSQVVSRLGEKL